MIAIATLLLLGVASSTEVVLVQFPSAAHKFKELNDPVMGGKSSGTWTVDTTNNVGVFDGEVVNVPSLKAPGFITAASNGKFPDASAMLGGSFVLKVRSSTPDYKGFRFSFASGAMNNEYACAGGGTLPFSRGCFKSQAFDVSSSDFVDVKIPINSFSDKWSPSTGEQTTTCAKDSSVCPTAKTLKNIDRVQIWAEGAAGKVHLEIQSISIVGPNGSLLLAQQSPVQPPASNDYCQGPVQSDLRFNISTRDTPETLSQYVDGNETLAEAVCCDRRTEALAEPRFTYMAPDISLFTKVDANGVTTFYDSVCGVPVFKAPVGRTLAAFKADTEEHGWPSFRPQEVVQENIKTDKTTGYVTSSCGTHLGSYLPDEQGDRWCIDLSCIAGRPKK